MLRAATRLAPRLAPRAEAALGTRGMSLAGMKGYDDKEAAEEAAELTCPLPVCLPAPHAADAVLQEAIGELGDWMLLEESMPYSLRCHLDRLLAEDERLLRRLLSKVRKSAEQHDQHAAVGAIEADKSSLKAIVGKYNISDADMQALLEWKHDQHH
ncbi:hypothetical protein CHLNCDRAFT_133937 [Chlorella variabilis]|uniref:Uncharacterized protein n=1 Tax=Chlorella variabilis TaxID=554065 RepID=E1ZEM0_CHLVA|nr:hypothetical protein CHLNCDRAFT_133937 [Chlorella variabilis]EFN55519.1 hypothetical protein CHLNCDRAFT_133937 [Chlorella variabilis]|eukprot:XP_005847621.1 hypothetical protein CHLNCDRAFT_133937 [Chlorella variabilis]